MKGNKSFIRLIKSDIVEGIIKRWYCFLIPVLVGLIVSVDYLKNISYGFSLDIKDITFMDYCANMFLGVEKYNSNDIFSFPIFFITYILVPFILFSVYPFNDFQERAKVIFIRTQKRSTWWYSKCIWNICSVLLYMAILYATVYAFSIITGNTYMDFNYFLAHAEISLSSRIMQLIVVPTATTIALCLAQMVISIETSPIYGVMAQIIQIVISVFFLTPVLPANFYMYKRSGFFYSEGISIETELVVCAMISIIAVIAGRIIVEKKDIL